MKMIINKNIVDLRKKPDSWSERVSQALFNTTCRIQEHEKDWAYVETPDDYSGWIKRNHLSEPLPQRGREWKIKSLFAPVMEMGNQTLVTKFTFDTRFQGIVKGDYVWFELPVGVKVRIEKDKVKPVDNEEDLSKIGNLAKRFLGTPYLWGGVSPFGFDCSGFIQRLYNYCGIKLPRDTEQQVKVGSQVKGLDDSHLGDLIFFPHHVGLYLGRSKIIHSCSHANGVATTDLNGKSGYSKHLKDQIMMIRRIFN